MNEQEGQQRDLRLSAPRLSSDEILRFQDSGHSESGETLSKGRSEAHSLEGFDRRLSKPRPSQEHGLALTMGSDELAGRVTRVRNIRTLG